MYKQLIIARKDLHMSAGKLSAQVSHASMSFITTEMRNPLSLFMPHNSDKEGCYVCHLAIEKGVYDNWINESYTKVVCEAKNRNHLLKAKRMAEELRMVEGVDFFLIEDNCRTELTPEIVDENGIGRCLTCIGFKPFPEEIIDKIGKKYQLYK